MIIWLVLIFIYFLLSVAIFDSYQLGNPAVNPVEPNWQKWVKAVVEKHIFYFSWIYNYYNFWVTEVFLNVWLSAKNIFFVVIWLHLESGRKMKKKKRLKA